MKVKKIRYLTLNFKKATESFSIVSCQALLVLKFFNYNPLSNTKTNLCQMNGCVSKTNMLLIVYK